MPNSVTEWLVESALKHAPAHGPGVGGQLVREAIAAKKFRPYQLNLQHVAEGCFGRAYEPRLKRLASNAEWVAEATDAVDLSAFRGIIGNTVAAVMDAQYQDATSVADKLVGKWEDPLGDPMSPVTLPYRAFATDPSRDVAPGTDYPRTGFSPWYIEVPRADKHGLIAVLTLELVKANRARQFLDAAGEVARKVGIEELKRKLRLVLGITQNYKRNGTTYGTYLTSGDRVNQLTDLNLGNGPAELDRMSQLFDAMVDPATGEPMSVDPTTILTVRGNRFLIRETIGTQQIRLTNALGETVTTNPFDFGGEILTDRYVYNLLVAEGGLSPTQAATWVAMGDFPRAFKWREVEPFHTFEVGPTDEAWPPAFFQDVVYACKARFWGAGFVADPFAVAAGYKAS